MRSSTCRGTGASRPLPHAHDFIAQPHVLRFLRSRRSDAELRGHCGTGLFEQLPRTGIVQPGQVDAGLRERLDGLRVLGDRLCGTVALERPLDLRKPLLLLAQDREVRELERLVAAGVLSPEVAAPALTEARRKAQATRGAESSPEMPWTSEKLWRETVARMREVSREDDVAAARAVLQDLVGPVKVEPADGSVFVELAARQMLGTGSGIWVGSGGRI